MDRVQKDKSAQLQKFLPAQALTSKFQKADLTDRFLGSYGLPAINRQNVTALFKKLKTLRLALAFRDRVAFDAAFFKLFEIYYSEAAKRPSSESRHTDLPYVLARLVKMASEAPRNMLKSLANEELVERASGIRLTTGEDKRSALKLRSRLLYNEMVERSRKQGTDLLALAGFENKIESRYSKMDAKALMQETLRFIRINGIRTLTELQNAKETPYWEIYRRDRKAEAGEGKMLTKLREYLEPTRRNLSAMTNLELVAEGERIIKENGLESIQGFAKKDPYLVGKLVERGIDPISSFRLADEGKKQQPTPRAMLPAQPTPQGQMANVYELYPEQAGEGRQYMDWKGMKNEKEITDFIWNVMRVNGLSLTQLRKSPEFSYCYEKARDLGIRHILQEKTRRMGIRFLHKTEDDERIDFSLMDSKKLLRHVEKMKITSVEELLRYRSLCVALDRNSVLASVISRLSQNGSGQNGNGRKKANGNSGRNESSNIIELYPKGKKGGKQRKAA